MFCQIAEACTGKEALSPYSLTNAHLSSFNVPQFVILSNEGAQTQEMDSKQLAAPAF